ncbi:MAG: DNA internalization-related competence protein ComEC/Rec2 [Gammaproteobacteria bacterium]|nr:DNA internalization-related competence protein ComEC/Rec2 [Gammaproteobacteria bacterium]
MRLGALAFLAGILAFQQLADVPDRRWCWLLIPLSLAAFVRFLRFPALIACGFLWTLLHVSGSLSTTISPSLEGEDVMLEGMVASIPAGRERGVRFEFDVTSVRQGQTRYASPERILLSWYDHVPDLRVGDTWRLQARLKQARGLMNPGGFDYEGWLFRHDLRAVGYVRAEGGNQRIATEARGYAIDRLRQRIAEGINVALPASPYAGIITALAIGEQRAISAAQWEVFARTGTTHLVAISGSHITLVAGLLFFLARWSWSRAGTLALRWPAPKAAAVIALLGAVYYAALAGFSVPVQRALIMIVVVMLGILWQRHRALSHTLAVALLAVLLYDPLAVMEAGFWLSFGTVALILFAMGNRLAPQGIWWQWGRLHWLITVGLLPVMLVLFQRVSLVSPLANFIAVPWINVLVVPPVLAGALLTLVSPLLGGWILALTELCLAGLWLILKWLSDLDVAQWTQHAPPWWALLPGLVGVALLLAPKGLPGRWLGVVWLLPIFFLPLPRPAAGEVWFTLLDVGQGLAAVVRTRDHALVFDTGPRFSDSFDTGEAVVIPYLRAIGVTRLDALIISHGDNDHIGGASSILKETMVRRTLSGVPGALPGSRAEQCASGQRWRWDGVDFEIISPPPGEASDDNNGACVLRIANGGGILLPADIEKEAERRLLDTRPQALPARILVAPHHGSKTSSTQDFLDAVRPEYVLFPAGYRNRYGHPKPEVVARYRAMGVKMYDSAHHGAITFRLDAKGRVTSLETYRQSGRRYWHAP